METQLGEGILGSVTNPEREYKLQYDRVHHWLIYHFGNAPFCIFDTSHQSWKFQWANVTGVYAKDLDNFLPMCRSCHAKFDITDKSRAVSRQTLNTNRIKLQRKVSRIDDTGVVTGTYPSIREAAKANNVALPTIWQGINKGYKAGGYRWMYS